MAVTRLALAPPGPSFFRRIAAARFRVLMLDYDGTLAPFRVERDRAVPYPGVRGTRRGAACGGTEPRGRSDRPRPRRDRRLAWRQSAARGLGLPRLGAPRARTVRSAGFRFPKRRRSGLGLARAFVTEHGLEAASEVKPASVALHWRGEPAHVAAAREREARRAWTPIAERHGLELRPFDGGIELRASGRDKGAAVREILSEAPPGTASAYLGDDLTDEDAFQALPEDALGVLVREELRSTKAGAWVRPPEGLLDFLDRWLAAEADAAAASGTKGAAR